MAELIFKNLIQTRGVAQKFAVTSCGTSSCEAGNPVYPPAQRMLERHAVKGTHTARKVTKNDIETSDYLLVMDESNARDLLRIAGESNRDKIYKLCSFTDRPRDVADPWYTRDFERAYTDISEGCEAFLDWVLKESEQA